MAFAQQVFLVAVGLVLYSSNAEPWESGARKLRQAQSTRAAPTPKNASTTSESTATTVTDATTAAVTIVEETITVGDDGFLSWGTLSCSELEGETVTEAKLQRRRETSLAAVGYHTWVLIRGTNHTFLVDLWPTNGQDSPSQIRCVALGKYHPEANGQGPYSWKPIDECFEGIRGGSHDCKLGDVRSFSRNYLASKASYFFGLYQPVKGRYHVIFANCQNFGNELMDGLTGSYFSSQLMGVVSIFNKKMLMLLVSAVVFDVFLCSTTQERWGGCEYILRAIASVVRWSSLYALISFCGSLAFFAVFISYRIGFFAGDMGAIKAVGDGYWKLMEQKQAEAQKLMEQKQAEALGLRPEPEEKLMEQKQAEALGSRPEPEEMKTDQSWRAWAFGEMFRDVLWTELLSGNAWPYVGLWTVSSLLAGFLAWWAASWLQSTVVWLEEA